MPKEIQCAGHFCKNCDQEARGKQIVAHHPKIRPTTAPRPRFGRTDRFATLRQTRETLPMLTRTSLQRPLYPAIYGLHPNSESRPPDAITDTKIMTKKWTPLTTNVANSNVVYLHLQQYQQRQKHPWWRQQQHHRQQYPTATAAAVAIATITASGTPHQQHQPLHMHMVSL